MFGLGGIFVEILKDVAFRVAPVNMPSCRTMIREIKGLGMLQGAEAASPAIWRHWLKPYASSHIW